MLEKRAASLCVLVLLLGLLGGCAGWSSDEPVDAPPAERTRGGEISLPLWEEAEGVLNPLWADSPADLRLSTILFQGLFAPGPRVELVPRLAQSYQVLEEGLSLEFTLRPDVLWHDGTPFTSEDVLLTWHEILHPEYSGGAFPREEIVGALKGAAEYREGRARSISGIETPDEHTVLFRLNHPFSPLLTRLAFQPIVPAHIRKGLSGEGGYESGLESWKSTAIGTGPFLLEGPQRGDVVTLSRHEDYYLGSPYLDKLVFRAVSPQVAAGRFETGDLDVLPFDLPDLEEVSRLEGARIISQAQLAYTYLGFNMDREPLGDPALRQALSLAVDTQSLLERVLKGHGTPLAGPAIPTYWIWEDPPGHEYDLARARELLDSRGWVRDQDGWLRNDANQTISIRLVYPLGDGVREQVALVVADALRELGVIVNADGLEYDQVLVEVFEKREFDMYLLGWDLALDPDPTPIWVTGSPWNITGFESPASDQLLEEARITYDKQERASLYRNWDRLVAGEYPYIFLYVPHGLTALREGLEDVQMGPTGYVGEIHRWWFKTE